MTTYSGLAQRTRNAPDLTIMCPLEGKFHPLPESARQRIAAADAETLLVWGERVLDANNLDEVWGG